MKLKDVNDAYRIGGHLLMCRELSARLEESAAKGHEFSLPIMDREFSIPHDSVEYREYVDLARSRLSAEMQQCEEWLRKLGVDPAPPAPPPEPATE